MKYVYIITRAYTINNADSMAINNELFTNYKKARERMLNLYDCYNRDIDNKKVFITELFDNKIYMHFSRRYENELTTYRLAKMEV